MNDAPRIDSLDHLQRLCESDTDRELWQCLAEGAALDMGIRPVNVVADTWRNSLQAIHWQRTRLVDSYPIHKSRDGLLMIEQEDAVDLANQTITDEINLYLDRLFGGKEDMPATKTKKPDPKTLEHFDDLLKRSLTPGAELQALKGKDATDDELLVAIKQAWRKPLVPGPRKYTVSTAHPQWDTAIWFDTISQSDVPSLSSKGGLITRVRDLLNINWTGEPATLETNGHVPETDKAKFETIKRKGKGKAILHPSTTSTSTPAGILANDPDAIVGPADDERADLGPIEDFLVSGMKDSPYQTRGEPSDDWLSELADSMNEEGQLQPCLVRPDGELIGGHTRWRAAQRLKWVTLQVRIVKCDDATARRLVLLDNAKRKDLSDRERCQAYCDLVDDYKSRGRTQLDVAKKLGIDETTLSNIVRLRSIPDVLWAHYEAKCLSIDQMRKLTVHAEREKFVAAFMSHLKAIGCDDEVPETGHFESAFDRGIESCFRPMQKDQYRDSGCLFKPNAIDRELLEIVEVERRWHGKVRMAANITLWNKLQKAAKAELKKAKQGAVQSTANLKAGAKAQAEAAQRNRQRYLEHSWDTAIARGIGKHFGGKLKKADAASLVRLNIYIESFGCNAMFDVDELIGDEAGFYECCQKRLVEFFDIDRGDWEACNSEDLRSLATWLGIDPAQHWRPTHQVLECCTEGELRQYLCDCELEPEGPIGKLLMIEQLLEAWPEEWVPNEFCLEQPKPKKPAKKKAKAK